MEFPEPVIFAELPSSQDKAFQLAAEDSLPVWGSVLAKIQTAGRGQTRKKWTSLPENLMVSLRLPQESPFTEQASAIAAATLVTEALNSLGIKAGLKWPNDPVLRVAGSWRKAGGILVEERNGIIIAGIGLNLNRSPSQIELESGFLPPCRLLYGKAFADPEEFWRKLLAAMRAIHDNGKENGKSYAASWNALANRLLVWQGEKVIAKGENISGILKGIGTNGALLLEDGHHLREVTSGSVHLA